LDELDVRNSTDPDFTKFLALTNPKPISIYEAQQFLMPDEALLVYLTTDRGTQLWVIAKNQAKTHLLNIDARTLNVEIKALRSRLDPKLNPNLQPFPATRAYALYERILGRVLPDLGQIHHLLIVPDGALEGLPFGALVTSPPKEDPEDLKGHRAVMWLARDYAITVLPSVSSFSVLRQTVGGTETSAPFLGIGDPTLRTGVHNDTSPVGNLPPLPETAIELRTIARSLGASDEDVLLAERASEAVLRQLPLDRYKVIEFATHGLMSGELKSLEPALVLTPDAIAPLENDGLLTASKIATLRLNADWVVLSACNTAAGDGTPDAEGLSGLARAFFYAGARSLLVSHWPVLSEAAVPLTIGAFGAMAKDSTIGRAEALRRSMMAMLDSSNPEVFAHPAAWAPFVLIGEGGRPREGLK
jgi:CHAT domain-containing protein